MFTGVYRFSKGVDRRSRVLIGAYRCLYEQVFKGPSNTGAKKFPPVGTGARQWAPVESAWGSSNLPNVFTLH